ncbi:ABC transporter ATP-binding protein [Nitrosophilus kaiyonis]|uniref:ABC transporter ATP-binding protein n=1 Tax=Nitrosophilus kaiyonis TaxID=2930200 RepID=UPI0031EB59C1
MIAIKNVTKIYNYQTNKEVVALKDINLNIKRSEFVILMGPSGSGKSTLLSIIAALTKPTFGTVFVKDENISKLPDRYAALFRREHIGFIFQKFNLIEDLNVFDNVILPMIPSNIDSKELEKKAIKVMKDFSIYHKKDTIIRKLSGGEQQRCAIARAMINSPEIILADEPTANLDAKLTKDFINMMEKLKDEGKTVVIATHDPRFEKLSFIDKIIQISEGKIDSIFELEQSKNKGS